MTTSDEWIAAGLAVAISFLIGTVLGWSARRALAAPSMRGELQAISKPTGLFLFWFSVAVGVGVAVGILSPASLDSIPTQVLEFLPHVLTAGLILLAGYALAIAAGQIATRTIGAAAGSGSRRVGTLARFAVMTAAAILALAQLGVDVTILTILVAAAAFGLAGAAALLVGLGGKDVASALAAGRYVRRHVDLGYQVELDEISGTVIGLHEATIELQTDGGAVVHLPYSIVLTSGAVLQPPTDT